MFNINYKKYKLFNSNFKKYKLFQVGRKKYKFLILHLIVFVAIPLFTYLFTPFFFEYSTFHQKLEKKIFNEFNLKTEIKGKIKYTFIPTPRLKVYGINFKEFVNDQVQILNIDNIIFKIPFSKLMNFENIDFKKMQINNVKIKVNLNKLNEYKKVFYQNFKSKPIKIQNSQINFYNGDQYVASINEVNLNYRANKVFEETIIKGRFLSDEIQINFRNQYNIEAPKRNLSIRLKNLGFLTNINLFEAEEKSKNLIGNAKLSFLDNKIIMNFLYKDETFEIKNGNIRNDLFDGKIKGFLSFVPFFDFNLNFDVSSLNFKRVYYKLLNFNKNSKNNLFDVSKKINGKLNLFINKIYSNSKFIQSAESKIEFTNGDIVFHRLLLNLGKIGASDITGIVENNKGFVSLKFKQNVFIDNFKYFYNKFTIKQYPDIGPKNYFISGNVDLKNFKIYLNEISSNEEISNEDKDFIEKNINSILLENKYASFFDFFKLKQLVKLILVK